MLYSKKVPLVLKLSDSDNPVEIKLTSYFRIRVKFIFKFNDNNIFQASNGKVYIANAAALKGKTIIFSGKGLDIKKQGIRVRHTIKEINGEETTYIFPDNYSDSPDYSQSVDDIPSYNFKVRFI
ncbi:MAG: hypothetical protein P9M05_05730 [Candidatus Stygibacter australis]|nr:hypothetical protein [Candidatus Stygibacter australis]